MIRILPLLTIVLSSVSTLLLVKSYFMPYELVNWGFPAQVMRDAYEYYAGQVTNEQRFIERAFDKVFRYWYVPVNPSMNFSIQPIKYMNSDGNTSA